MTSSEQQIAEARSLVAQRQAQIEAARTAPQQVTDARAKSQSAGGQWSRRRRTYTQRKLNLSYTKIYAPVSGVIGRKTVELGHRVQPGQGLMVIVPLDDIWITANFKETQLKKMRPGQSVEDPCRHLRPRLQRQGGEPAGRGRSAVQPVPAGKCDRQLREGGAALPGADPLRRGPGSATSVAAGHVRRADGDVCGKRNRRHHVRTQDPASIPWFIAVTVTLATFMELLDTSIANVSLPYIGGGLGRSYDEVTWILTTYLVANAVVLPMSAWLSRVFGRQELLPGLRGALHADIVLLRHRADAGDHAFEPRAAGHRAAAAWRRWRRRFWWIRFPRRSAHRRSRCTPS